MSTESSLVRLVGAGLDVPCLDGTVRPYRDLDCAASTPALESVEHRVAEFLPWYSSVHRGSGFKSRRATAEYERARDAVLHFAGRDRADRDDVAILCRNTTEALNHLAYRLPFQPGDVVVTTVVEHHANMLPWARVAERRFIECNKDGTFALADVIEALEAEPHRRVGLLAITGASNVTGWLPPIDEICAAAHERGVPVVVDAAQLAPHRPLPLSPDYIALSGHKMYAPYGAGALIGPRSTFASGEPFLAGGGAVDLVDIDEVIWTDPPEREEAGSPNVIGAVAFGAALGAMEEIGWDAIVAHERALAHQLRRGLSAIEGVTLLGPDLQSETLAVAPFTVSGLHYALVAARLSAEWGIGVRHGCFCAHPLLLRLLGLGPEAVNVAREQVQRGDRRAIPGAVRASCGLGTTSDDLDLLLEAVSQLAGGLPEPAPYHQDPVTGDFWPATDVEGWRQADRPTGAACARG
jgi:selenocysteine lyase/cysteine desulfurase